jgi:hypothetical protein
MAKKTSKSRQAYYAAAKSSAKQATNRRRKLQKLLKTYPNNLQLTEALNNAGYRRKTPTTSKWSHSEKASAQLMREALHNPLKIVATKLNERKMFQLGVRAHDRGTPVWVAFSVLQLCS